MRIGKTPIVSDASLVATPDSSSFGFVYFLSTNSTLYIKKSDGNSVKPNSSSFNTVEQSLGGAIQIELSSGNNFICTVEEDGSLNNPRGGVDGEVYTVVIIQGSGNSGNNAVTLDSAFYSSAGFTMVTGTGNAAIIKFQYVEALSIFWVISIDFFN